MWMFYIVRNSKCKKYFVTNKTIENITLKNGTSSTKNIIARSDLSDQLKSGVDRVGLNPVETKVFLDKNFSVLS